MDSESWAIAGFTVHFTCLLVLLQWEELEGGEETSGTLFHK